MTSKSGRPTITVWEFLEAWQKLEHLPTWRRVVAHSWWWFKQGRPDVIDPRK